MRGYNIFRTNDVNPSLLSHLPHVYQKVRRTGRRCSLTWDQILPDSNFRDSTKLYTVVRPGDYCLVVKSSKKTLMIFGEYSST